MWLGLLRGDGGFEDSYKKCIIHVAVSLKWREAEIQIIPK